jgi:hypothetical protein
MDSRSTLSAIQPSSSQLASAPPQGGVKTEKEAHSEFENIAAPDHITDAGALANADADLP